jgi:drug/metabolite transporter (DMT)-like permease
MIPHPGEFAALLTAIFWTVTALSFEAASRKIGAIPVNIIRLIVGFAYLSIFTWIFRGFIFPVDASYHNWIYLILSGLIGFTFGDLCLFKAYVVIGARISMLIMALAPPMTALTGWLFLGERLTLMNMLGMAITLAGVVLVVVKRRKDGLNGNRIQFSYPVWGILLAFGGAVGQAVGLVLSKYGMGNYDTFAATQIRVIAGIAGFTVMFTIRGYWKEVFRALLYTKPMLQLTLGAFFGPFLGVSFSLLAIKYKETGIAAIIMSIIPVLIILPSVILFKEKVTVKEVFGAVLAVGGVALFFIV